MAGMEDGQGGNTSQSDLMSQMAGLGGGGAGGLGERATREGWGCRGCRQHIAGSKRKHEARSETEHIPPSYITNPRMSPFPHSLPSTPPSSPRF